MECPRCGFKMPDATGFCSRCGSPMDPQGSPPANPLPEKEEEKRVLEGERRKVTCLFADISGYTSLSETLDPEDLASLANQLFQVLGDAIQKYGGTVDKYMGDCVMAIFGAPVSHENDPERALRASLEMMARAKQKPHGVDLHIGVNTGEVLAGRIGSDAKRDYTVMGDVVNTAQRLTSAAPAGEIYASPAVRKLTGHLFEFDELAPFSVKGKKERIRAYRLKGLREEPAASRGVPGLPSQFVGREAELALLRDRLASTRRGRSAVVFIAGEAGVGKSRLLAEFRRSLGEDVMWLEGRCSSYGSASQFHAFTQLLKEALFDGGTREPDTAARTMERMRSVLPDKWSETAAPLERLLNVRFETGTADPTRYLDARTLRLRTFVAVRDLLAALASRRPVVVAIDDLHWADESSHDLLKFIIDTTAGDPIMMMCLGRRSAGSRWEELGRETARKMPDQTETVELQGLERSQMEELLDLLLGNPEMGKELRESIIDRSAGSPFCLEEIIKNLMDGEVLLKREGKWTCRQARAELTVPETVEAVISSRVDRLEPGARRLVMCASVFGDDFSHGDLICMIGPDHPAGRRLEDLERAGLVARSADQPGRYRFAHPLIQEVIYGTILKSERKELHLKAAECTERRYPDSLPDRYAVLAGHYETAGNRTKASFFYAEAGRRARETFANSNAIASFSRSLDLLAQTGDGEESLSLSVNLLIERGRIYRLVGETESALRDYSEALRLSTGTRHRKSRADALLGLSQIYGWTSKFPEMEKASAQALELYRELGDSVGEAESLSQLGYARQLSGDLPGAIELHERSLFLSTTTDNRLEQSNCLNNLGAAYYSLGELGKAVRYFEESLEIKRTIGDLEGEAANLHNLGYIKFTQGDHTEALRLLQASLKQKERIGDRAGAAVTMNSMAAVHAGMGDLKKGLEWGRQALAARRDVGDIRGQGYTLLNISRMLALTGPMDEAVRTMDLSLKIMQEVKDREGEAAVLVGMARTQIDTGEMEEAGRSLARALSVSQEIGARQMLFKAECESALLDCIRRSRISARESVERLASQAPETSTPDAKAAVCWLRSCLHAMQGDVGKAKDFAAAACQLEKEGVDRAVGARWRAHLATILKSSGADQEAKVCSRASEAIFAELGAGLWVERLKEHID